MKYYIVYSLLAMLMLSACSSGESPDYASGGDIVSLSFNMVTTGPVSGSRADSSGHSEIGSEFRDFEDGIDIGDLGVFIFLLCTSPIP
ncbi:MAG: hypothetical protein K2H98_04730, partial [Duncaniella sp.]|nr:hypothetical protein [Duncaniella sp.]